MDAVQTDDFREIIRDTFPAGSLKKRVWAPCKNGGRLGKYVFFLFVLGNLSIFRGRTVKLPGEYVFQTNIRYLSHDGSMGLKYLPTNFPQKSTNHVGKYTIYGFVSK